MNQHELMTKLIEIKGNLQHLIGGSVQRFLKSYYQTSYENTPENLSSSEGKDNYIDDLPLTLSREASPGIKYYSTENSEFSRGAEKEPATGIDHFDEEDGVEVKKKDKFQNSDLAKRFYTHGMNLDDLNK